MEETIIFRQTPDAALQRAVVAVNNTTGCDVIYKVEANVNKKQVRIKPAQGFINVNDKAEVEILRRYDATQDRNMKVTVSYTPAQSKVKDFQTMWANAPANMVISKVLTCVMDEGNRTTQNYHLQDIRVGGDPRERSGFSMNNTQGCNTTIKTSQSTPALPPRGLMLNSMPTNDVSVNDVTNVANTTTASNMQPRQRMSHVACLIPKSPREMGGGPPQICYPGPDMIPTENYCNPVRPRGYQPMPPPANTACCAPGDSCFLLICVCVLVGFVVGNLLIEMI